MAIHRRDNTSVCSRTYCNRLPQTITRLRDEIGWVGSGYAVCCSRRGAWILDSLPLMPKPSAFHHQNESAEPGNSPILYNPSPHPYTTDSLSDESSPAPDPVDRHPSRSADSHPPPSIHRYDGRKRCVASRKTHRPDRIIPPVTAAKRMPFSQTRAQCEIPCIPCQSRTYCPLIAS